MNVSSQSPSSLKQMIKIAVVASLLFSSAMFTFAVTGVSSPAARRYSYLAKYTTDLTQLGHDGKLRSQPGFEGGVAQLVRALGKAPYSQPVMVDDRMDAQDELVEQLAVVIANGSAPNELTGKHLVRLETALLFSDIRTGAVPPEVVRSIIDEASALRGQNILYVDDLAMLIADRSVAEAISKGVSDGSLKMIGACTAGGYGQIESRPDMAAIFEPISLNSR